jgi:hypothetical protein
LGRSFARLKLSARDAGETVFRLKSPDEVSTVPLVFAADVFKQIGIRQEQL